MRASAVLGLGCSAKSLKPFQSERSRHRPDLPVEWRIGMPASPNHADVILIFGGDGTVHRHLGQLVKLGLPVLVVPAGSGNDFARALGLRNVRDSLKAWQEFRSTQANVRSIDLGVIAPWTAHGAPAPHEPLTRYFCCVAGAGLDAEVARRANILPRWLRGHGGYALTLLPTIFRFAARPMKILVAQEQEDEEHAETATAWTLRSDQLTILAAFANSPVYGGGMKIAPNAKMDDGLLDVCVIGGIGPFKLACMFPTVYFGRHLHIREVSYFPASRLRVETETPLDLYADGEYVCQTPVEISMQRAVLKVVMRGC